MDKSDKLLKLVLGNIIEDVFSGVSLDPKSKKLVHQILMTTVTSLEKIGISLTRDQQKSLVKDIGVTLQKI